MDWIKEHKTLAAILGGAGVGALGLGYMLWSAWETFSVEQMYVGLMMFALLGFALTWGIEALERWTHPDLQPDRTVLVDLPPQVAAARLAAARPADRFEAEQAAFFSRVRDAYLERAQRDPQRFIVLDGTQAPAVLQAQIAREFP